MNTLQHQQDDGHIIMFPYMAQGHITRFLALARFISQRKPNIKITFVSTPLNIRRLQSALTSDKNIHLAELPFSSADHGLPADSDNTNSLPPHLILTLLYASENLKPLFDNLITQIIATEKRVPNCIIGDTLYGWVHDIAKRVGTLHFAFTCGAYGSAMFISTCLHLPHRRDDSSNDLIEEFQVPKVPGKCRPSQLPVYLREANKETPHVQYFRKQLSCTLQADGMLCNSVEEIEVVGLEALRNIVESKPVWTVGPLLPSYLLQGNNQNKNKVSVASQSRTGKEFGISPESCIEWLNLHEPSSVLYISFGSESAINASQMMELALGLEKSGKSFIWILRPPNEFDIKSEFKSEWLPEGFFERMNESNKGLLVKKWAPQLEILSHKSTGAFLSHCGWNSVLESLSLGVPIIGWPLGGEQAFNSKMLEEELGVSVQLANGNEDEVSSEDVQKVIEQVMDSSEGEEMRKRAMVIAEKISAAMREDEGGHLKGSTIRSIDDFLATVTSK
ncbi:hypothetical protein C5167_032010 [Papaver somniferum]|uniref:Glycosyltransferase n=1 Tax=Papaver somniferum TaxID=3469 RepID=A0A4Y7K6G5_PAPSO|nr:UDP-glycosyltransferase 92A1-like [Papaver somniferum]RZC68934.1 hypothetical protein C5167_032010 [Papaver somniferum]